MSGDRFLFRAWVPDNDVTTSSYWGMWSCDRMTVINSQREWRLHRLSGGWGGETSVYQIYHLTENNLVIMQSMDMRDCNGNVIFEGDIVKTTITDKEYNLTVHYDNHTAGFYFREIRHGGVFRKNDFADRKVEIIGNRYENPELLEAEKS